MRHYSLAIRSETASRCRLPVRRLACRCVLVPWSLLIGCEESFALHRPVDEPLHLFPAGLHRLTLKEDHDEAVPVLLIARGKAGPSCFSNARLDADVPIETEQLVRVDPAVRVFLFYKLYCLTLALTCVPIIYFYYLGLFLRGFAYLALLLKLLPSKGPACICLRPYYLSERGRLHRLCRESRHVVGGRPVLNVHQAVRAVKVGAGHLQS